MTNSNLSFDSIKEAVCAWVNEVETKYSAELSIERPKNEPDIFLAYIWFKKCAAQVIVTDPEWAPYRYVGFEVWAFLGKEAQVVFSWYDSDEDDVESILQKLQAGIEYAVRYNRERHKA